MFNRIAAGPLAQTALAVAEIGALATLALVGVTNPPQLRAQLLRFDVASVKAADPSAPHPGRMSAVPVVTTPGRLTARNATLNELIKGAYGIEDYQVSGGPGWTLSARFDVEGKPTGSADRNQLLLMLRALLTNRFHLAVHRETKELAIYALVAAKSGPKFHALKPAEAACFPLCAGPTKTNHLRQKDLPTLATFLTRLGSDRPVIDKTGLTGYFDLDLDMSKIMDEAGQSGAPPSNGRMFEAAVSFVQDELGLKLTPTKAPVEVLVIDHAEKPSGN